MPARELQRKPRAEAVVAKALVRAAQRLGVSQSELAEVLGTSAASVSRTFGGERPIAQRFKDAQPHAGHQRPRFHDRKQRIEQRHGNFAHPQRQPLKQVRRDHAVFHGSKK